MIRVRPPYGGFTMAACALEARYGTPFTRQQVYAWHRRAALNGFPDQVEVTGKDGKKRKLLDLAKVIRWYATYHPNLGGRPLANISPEELSNRARERAFCQECPAKPGQPCRDGAGYMMTEVHESRKQQIAVAVKK